MLFVPLLREIKLITRTTRVTNSGNRTNVYRTEENLLVALVTYCFPLATRLVPQAPAGTIPIGALDHAKISATLSKTKSNTAFILIN